MTEPELTGSWWSEARRRVLDAAFSRTARNTYWLGSSSVLNGLLGAAASALLARSLGVEHFGTYTLMLTLVNTLADLCDLGLASALIRFGAEFLARDDHTGFTRVLAAILRLKALLAAAVMALAALLVYPMLPLLFSHVDARIASYSLIVMATSVLSILASVFPPVLQAHGDFRSGALTSLARSVSRVLLIAGVVTVWGGLDVSAALWIDFASVLLFLVAGAAVSPVRRFRLASDPELTGQVLVFTRWVSLYQLITLLGTRLDVFLVGGLADARTLSIYGAAAKVSGLVTAVTNAYYAVLLSSISMAAASPGAVAARSRQARIITAGLSAAMALLAAGAEPVVHILYGDAYVDAIPVLQIMCVGLMFTVLAYPVSAVLFARKKTAGFPVMAALSAAGLIGGNLLLLPRWGAAGAAAAFSLSAFLAWAAATTAGALERRRPPT